MEQQHIEHAPHDTAHNILHTVGDVVGYWWILALLAVGAVAFFRKKLISILKRMGD